MTWNIELKEKGLRYTLLIKKTTSVGELPKIIGENYMKIFRYLGELGEQPTDAPFVAYYNLDMEHLIVELGFPVNKPLPGKDEIVAGEIPAGPVVTCLYKGPYKDMQPLYEEMMKWISDKGYESTGAYYEHYLNSPADVSSENDYLTRVDLPVRKK
ncbi:MAG: GyrI-like domain-containing protein [Clostridiaceae bacterium]